MTRDEEIKVREYTAAIIAYIAQQKTREKRMEVYDYTIRLVEHILERLEQ